MGDLSQRLLSLGREVAGVADASTRGRSRDGVPPEIPAARARFLAYEAPGARRRGTWAFACAAAFAALLAVVLFVGLRRDRSHALSFAVGPDKAPGAVGEWIAADGERDLPVRFSEGSELVLSQGARARVTSASEVGAAVVLEKGGVSASIAHTQPGTSWSLRAGPFDVAVTGTRFRAEWDAAAEVFEVSMEEGSVRIRGPVLHAEQALKAGERLRISVRDGAMELNTKPSPADSGDPSEAPEPAASGAVTAAPQAPPTSAVSAAPARNEEPSARKTPAFRELVGSGRYREALEAADRAGFTTTIERAPAGDLHALADAARFGGRPADARATLLAVRKRFGARGQTAFLLGKIAAESGGGDAATWFETYLAEEPGGALAEQALGRLMDIRRRADPLAGKALAARYLDRYPYGTYANLARSLLAP